MLQQHLSISLACASANWSACCASQVGVAATLGAGLPGHTLQDVPSAVAILALIFICIYVGGFAW